MHFNDLFAIFPGSRGETTHSSPRISSTDSSLLPGARDAMTHATTTAWCITRRDEAISVIRDHYHRA